MTFDDLLRHHLDGRTAVWLAHQIGAHEQTVRRWLAGSRLPSVTRSGGRASDLLRICDALRLPGPERAELAIAAGFDVFAPCPPITSRDHAPAGGAPSPMEFR